MTVPDTIFEVEVMALIDSAAQVTVISEDFFKNTGIQITSCEPVILKGAAKDGHMEAKLVKSTSTTIGGNYYH